MRFRYQYDESRQAEQVHAADPLPANADCDLVVERASMCRYREGRLMLDDRRASRAPIGGAPFGSPILANKTSMITGTNTEVEIEGFDSLGKTVFKNLVSYRAFCDKPQIWDDPNNILELEIVRIRGQLRSTDGDIHQEFESIFSKNTGECLETKATHY